MSQRSTDRIAPLGVQVVALLLVCTALTGCENSDTLDPGESPATVAAAFAGGIPFGAFNLPNGEFGDRYNGAHRNIAPSDLVASLSAIQSRGGRVVLVLAGGPNNYKDAEGHFSFSLWRSRVDRFRSVDFASFVADGTVFGHYLLDEPNDASNWNGEPIPGDTVEAMARYSKEIWPDLPTVVRVEPAYLAGFNVDYRYLDAAWAQYVHRKGAVGDFISRNVANAQDLGLELVVGLNILGGGQGGVAMTATEVRDWGSVLLGSSYPCAFISWKYDATYLGSAGVGEAMDALRSLAQGRAGKTCRGSGAPPQDPDPEPEPGSSPVTVTWTEPQDITYGTTLGAAQLNAAAMSGGQSVPGSFSYAPGPGTLLAAGENQTLTATFTPSDPDKYESATATVQIDVLPAAPALAWSVPATTLVGPLDGALLAASARGVDGASVAGTFTYSPAGGQVLDATPSQVLSVSFQPSGSNYTAATKSVSLAVRYPWTGFFEPVNNPGVLNRAKAGTAIPVRFSLGGNRPAPILAPGSPEVANVKCPSWSSDVIEQTVTASSSSLRYESSTGQYVYTWVTASSWAGKCRRLTLVLKDGTRHEAIFRFVR
ncbi:MAG TPA: PxKF domain-containing protein [Gemmatimonadales bacterium]|nr:PxKF domain-containing protein [Gemmatimonadales bacterium]